MPEAQPAQGQNGRQQQRGGGILSSILRMVVMWYGIRFFNGNKAQNAVPKDPGAMSFPKFQKGDLVNVYFFINEQPRMDGFNPEQAVFSKSDIPLAMPTETYDTIEYTPSMNVLNNGSVYLHAVFARSGVSVLDPTDPSYSPHDVFARVHRLNTYLQKPKNKTGVSLLTADAAEIDQSKLDEDAPRPIINFWKPNVTVAMVDHFIRYPKAAIPPQVLPFLTFDEFQHYYPLIHFDEFWLLRDKYVPLNETTKSVNLTICLSHMSMMWWQFQMQLEESFKMQTTMGMAQDGESDEIKRVFIEGNPYLLALTMVVSMLHSVFDFLAFKNDIGFWKNNKSMEGLSARSILINAACQLIITLYLFDNETSFVVLLSSVVGTGIEFWKVTKAMDVKFDPSRFPFISIKDRATYNNSNTKQYDADAMRYLSYALYPLVIGYAIYSLMYKTHKSWYSWILNSLVGAVYMFGFILMCPQLYLNYKLKSVAHLPWRQMTYKFLNTIIDDLFAFVIKMPILHRLSVFRDDVVFLVYIYQRWIYRVDKTRVNEFGWVPEENTPAVEEKKEGEDAEGEKEDEKEGEKEGEKKEVEEVEKDNEPKKDK